MSEYKRLTARSQKNNMAYLVNVKENEQEVDSKYPNTLRCILDSFQRLAQYEEIGSPEELAELAKAKAEGRLVILPCKVDDTVYVIPSDVNFRLNVANGLSQNNRVYEQVVGSIHFYKNGAFLLVTCGGVSSCHSDFYKTNWFLTREEAEAALKCKKCPYYTITEEQMISLGENPCDLCLSKNGGK